MDDPDLGQNLAAPKSEASEKIDIDEIARFAIEMGIVDINSNEEEKVDIDAAMEYENSFYMDEQEYRKERERMDQEDRQMIEEELSEQQVEIMQKTTEREYTNFLKMQCFPDEKNYKEVNSDGEECCSESGDSDTKRRRKGKKSPTKKRIPGKTRAAKKAEMYDGMSKEEIRQVRSGRHPVRKASKIGGKKREYSEISEEDSSTCPSSPLESEYSKYKNIGVQILH